jgi:small subunit ribosomal protein S16
MINSTTRRDGYVIEELGFYDPISKKIRININSITTRLKQGAQPSETVKNLLLKAQIISIK